MIKGLHHNAYRCRDSEETRRFYEDFLGLPLVNASRSRRPRPAARPAPACCTPSSSSTTARASPSSRRPTCRSSSRSSTTSTCTSRSRSSPTRSTQMFAKGKAEGREVRGISRPQVHPLDLLPRSQRLRDRADRQGPGPGKRDGSREEPCPRHAERLAGGQAPSRRKAAVATKKRRRRR